MFKNFTLLLLIIVSINLTAKDNIKIVGSSTVYPFSSAVAEELGATTDYPTPTVESTGSGGGMKLFCASNDNNAPDITNSSRKMKKKELELCHKNGVKNITEVMIGYDGIVFAQRKKNKPFTVTTKQLLLAVAKEVPNKKGNKLIANPYKKWSDIDSSLPKRKIIIYGPPKSSGTRDAFEDMILKHQTKEIKAYTNIYKKTGNKTYKKYKLIRTDGIYIPSGENDNLIVAKLDKNKYAFGIFGYSFLIENDDKVQSAKINGIYPTPSTISSGKYPISRSLFFYIKNYNSKKSKAIDKYVKMFMSEDMIGEDGILGEVGLISLPSNKRAKIRENVNKKVQFTLKSYL